MSKSKSPRPITLVTWCGSRVTLDRMPRVLTGWQSYARRLERQLKRMHSPKLKPHSLEFQLYEILSSRMGERDDDGRHPEDPVDCLCRILRERDRALMLLALDRLKATL